MKLQTPDLGPWMLKRWLYLFGLGFCFMVMLVNADVGSRLMAGMGLLIFIQLREISYVQDIDVARAVWREKKARAPSKRRQPEAPAPMPSQLDLDSRRDFAAWSMNSAQDYRPPSSY